MHRTLGVVLAVASASCSSAVVSTPSHALTAIATPASAALDSAYRRGDAAAVAALLTDSAIMSAEGIPDLDGRSAIRDVLAQFFGSNRVTAFTLNPQEMQLAGALAYERGTFTWSAGPRGGSISTRMGRYALLRVRESDGIWRLHRYIENCLPSPCP